MKSFPMKMSHIYNHMNGCTKIKIGQKNLSLKDVKNGKLTTIISRYLYRVLYMEVIKTSSIYINNKQHIITVRFWVHKI